MGRRPPPARLEPVEERRGPHLQAVCVEDRGSVVDAPTDVIRELKAEGETYHPRGHRSDGPNFRAKELAARTVFMTGEERCKGKGKKRPSPMTSVPPPWVRVGEGR